MRNGLRISLRLLSVNNISIIKCCHTIIRSNNQLLVYATVRPIATSTIKHNKSQQNPSHANKNVSLSEDSRQSEITSFSEKVKQTTKDVSYLGVILGGVGVICVIFYVVFRELFSSQSPSVIYTRAYKRCKSDSRVVNMLGKPIKGFGETTSRGRRRHVSSAKYEKNGVTFTRVRFYVQGPNKRGTVHAEVSSDSPNDFRYLFVEFDDLQRNVIVLEDNRT